MQIKGVSALVAGGASGLGEATTRKLHAEGAEVTVLDLNAERGEALVKELGERCSYVQADVTDPEGVAEAVTAASSRSDGLRISVCCAGIGWAEKTAGKRGAHTFETFATVVKVNLIGTFNLLRLAADAMRANTPLEDGERGICINTASIAAYDGQIGQIAYAASKGGIVSMTLPAARDLARDGIRVCSIAPGLFNTPLLTALPQEAREKLAETVPFPPRLGMPEEFASLVSEMVGNRVFNGETVRLDGALRMG